MRKTPPRWSFGISDDVATTTVVTVPVGCIQLPRLLISWNSSNAQLLSLMHTILSTNNSTESSSDQRSHLPEANQQSIPTSFPLSNT